MVFTMELTVKSLKGNHFEITVQPSDMVIAAKKNIEEAQGKDNFPCDQQLLIHNGKVLKDETTLEENKVSENGFLVVMLSKSKSSTQGGNSSFQSSTSNPVPAASAASAAPTVPESKSSSQAAAADPYDQAAFNLVVGNNLEQTIQQLMDMGGGRWDRETVMRALQAAYNNPERAVDYLYSGAPTAGTGAGSGSFDFLRNNQQFLDLRSMVQENPQLLQPMLQELSKQNPQLLRQIQEH